MTKVKVLYVLALATERSPEKQDLSLGIENTVNDWVKGKDVDIVGIDVSPAFTTQRAGQAIVTVLYKDCAKAGKKA